MPDVGALGLAAQEAIERGMYGNARSGAGGSSEESRTLVAIGREMNLVDPSWLDAEGARRRAVASGIIGRVFCNEFARDYNPNILTGPLGSPGKRPISGHGSLCLGYRPEFARSGLRRGAPQTFRGAIGGV